MLDILDIKSVALTNDSDVAMFCVRTPASLIDEAIVSVKWIIPVKMQTNINGVILSAFQCFLETFLPYRAAVANAASPAPAFIT
jgi:hypothetical protein